MAEDEQARTVAPVKPRGDVYGTGAGQRRDDRTARPSGRAGKGRVARGAADRDDNDHRSEPRGEGVDHRRVPGAFGHRRKAKAARDSEDTQTNDGLRLQKVLSALGIASRRAADDMVAEGRVRVNGEAAVPGTRVNPSDRVTVDGRRLALAAAFREDTRVLVYHKPVGVVCTRSDPEGRPTIFNDLPRSKRWISVGRLDINSSGLMLITTDGELANQLMHPRYGVEREYLVRVRGELTRDELAALREGPELDGREAAVESVTLVRGARDREAVDGETVGEGHGWYRIVIKEGRKREVRRLFEEVGHPVARLKRIRYGPVELPRGLAPGRHQPLDDALLAALKPGAGAAKKGGKPRPSGGGREGGPHGPRRSKKRASR